MKDWTRFDAITYTVTTAIFAVGSTASMIRTGEAMVVLSAWFGGMSLILAVEGWLRVRARRQNHTPLDN